MTDVNATAAAIPDWSQLDFARNCTAYGNWLAAFVAPNPWNPEEALGGSIPLTILLMGYALPPGWTFSPAYGGDGNNWTDTVQSPAGTAFFGDVMKWLTNNLYHTFNETDGQWYADTQFVDNVIWTPAEKCPREFCKAIAFTGNADLSGIGVIIAYYIEASLATIYLLVFSAWRIKRYWRSRHKSAEMLEIERAEATRTRGRLSRAAHRLFDALRGSLDSFMLASSVFALAILIAALVMEAEHTNEHRHHPVNSQNIPSGNALYDSALGLLVGLFVVFPPIVLYALLPQAREIHQHEHVKPEKEKRGRRTWLRRAVLIVLWGLASAVVFLDPKSELDYEYQGRISPEDGVSDNDNFATVLYACDQRGGRKYWRTLEATKYLVIGVPAIWLSLTLVVYVATGWRPSFARAGEDTKRAGREEGKERAAGEDRKGEERKEREGEDRKGFGRFARPIWRHFVAFLAMLIMWTILITLTELRHYIVETADGLDLENEWAVGQVLAIATWGPVAVDFAFLLIFGIEDGLGGRLPLDFTIQQVVSKSSVDLPGDAQDGDRDHAERARATGASTGSRVGSVASRAPRSSATATSNNNDCNGAENEKVDSDKTAVVLENDRRASSSPSSRPSLLRAGTSASSTAPNSQPSPAENTIPNNTNNSEHN